MSTKRSTAFVYAALGLAAAALLPQAGCTGPNAPAWVASLTPPTPSEVTRDAFNVYDADKRRRSIGLLANAPFGGEAPYVRTYRLLADDPDATVRAAAAQALGLHGGVEHARLLASMLKDEDPFVRWEAAKALQRIHSPLAVDPLVAAVQRDTDADVRMAAATALGQYPRPAVFDVLLGALNDRNFGVVQAARASLLTLTGQDLGTDPVAWIAWSRDRRSQLFAEQHGYTFQPYIKPPSLLDKLWFWREAEPVLPRPPVGLNVAADEASATPNG